MKLHDMSPWFLTMVILASPVVLAAIIVAIFPEAQNNQADNKTTAHRERVERIEAQQDRRKGFHCLSGWDGSHRQFKQEVKQMMKNPKSFEHIETRVTPARNGEHMIIMQYRAENSFGAVVAAIARGSFSNANCSHTILSIE